MSGFVGFANLNKDVSRDIYIIKDMNSKIQKKAADEEHYYIDKYVNLGYRENINNKKEKQAMSIRYNDVIYSIVYNGQIYNKEEVKKELQELGYEFERRFRYRIIVKWVYSFWN